jgi:hypothetical protein
VVLVTDSYPSQFDDDIVRVEPDEQSEPLLGLGEAVIAHADEAGVILAVVLLVDIEGHSLVKHRFATDEDAAGFFRTMAQGYDS